MITYTILIVFLVIIIFFTVHKKLKKRISKFPDLTNIIITLYTTFTGVFIAVDVTNYYEKQTEKNNTIKNIDITTNRLTYGIMQAKMYLILFQKDKDLCSSPKPITLPKIEFLNYFLSNEVTNRNLSQYGLEKILEVNDGFELEIKQYQNNDSNNNGELIEKIRVILKIIDYTTFFIKSLELEKKWIQNEISLNELKMRYDTLQHRLINDLNRKISKVE